MPQASEWRLVFAQHLATTATTPHVVGVLLDGSVSRGWAEGGSESTAVLSTPPKTAGLVAFIAHQEKRYATSCL